MMSLTFILAAFVSISCCSGSNVVRNRKSPTEKAQLIAEPEGIGYGFESVEDVPTATGDVKQTEMDTDTKTAKGSLEDGHYHAHSVGGGLTSSAVTGVGQVHMQESYTSHSPFSKVDSIISSSTVASAGSSAHPTPTFHNEGPETSSEFPDIVDKFQPSHSAPTMDDSITIPMVLLLACVGSAIAWIYTKQRNQAKDKAGAVMSMLRPLVQNASEAIGMADAASQQAQNASQRMFQKQVEDDDDDLMKAPDADQFDPSVGIESSFFDADTESAQPALESFLEDPVEDCVGVSSFD